ncbi:MAG: hypothetical protein EOS22_11265 [Mesorhizobium sp.]|uniref:hypothetical protein n=1 Tax=Mesorhizobium sp. TaxID=1871066 RepID=UPI000FE51446|nr:hypothetical protein [Mesorhizobium sp.]RWD28369.1 MAG: hypothetical protein EOS22_11265 [Mesorhizobium sp.]
MAALGGNFTAFWKPALIGRPKNRRMARNERHCLRPTGRGVADFVQISLGREIDTWLGRSSIPTTVSTAPTICSARPGCGVNL